jgi:hypothetical protein
VGEGREGVHGRVGGDDNLLIELVLLPLDRVKRGLGCLYTVVRSAVSRAR